METFMSRIARGNDNILQLLSLNKAFRSTRGLFISCRATASAAQHAEPEEKATSERWGVQLPASAQH